MYCVSCEVRTEFIWFVEESRPPLLSSSQEFLATEQRCIVFPVRYELNLCKYVMQKKVDRLCCLVVRVPGHRTEMYCVSCEVRTEFIYVMQKKVDRLCGLVARVPGYRSRGPGSIRGATRFSEK
jgi:hypothetical protein